MNMDRYDHEYDPADKDHRCGGCMRYGAERENGTHNCTAIHGPKDISADRTACKWYWDRAEFKKQQEEEARREEEIRQQRWKENEDNPPLTCEWEDMYDPMKDEVEVEAYPLCPNCREPLYETERCYFCGQKILMDDKLKAFCKPEEAIWMECPACGEKDTFKIIKAKTNGHPRGHCAACGFMFIV